jgi:hypothetical protein
MLQADQVAELKLSLPPHVGEILTGCAVFELQKTPEEVLELLAEELCRSEELRSYVADLLAP